MNEKRDFRIREQYLLANCCNPSPETAIVGYHSHADCIKIHTADCRNLAGLEQERLIPLDWNDVIVREEFVPDDLYRSLEDDDFRILIWHLEVGLDYSLQVAHSLRMDPKVVFNRHAKLRELGLLTRVPKVMIQYRKGIVDNKWIKHRNHTYYNLTDRGRQFAKYRSEASGNSII
jgi:hypothetical protein